MSQIVRLLLSSVLLAPAASLAAQQNTLVIVCDDLGWDAVQCYGLHLRAAPTPNIDALAAGGVKFTRAYVNPACSPTRSCLMTGRYGFHNGVATTIGGAVTGLNPNEVLLPTPLAAAGIPSALIGKWHLGLAGGLSTPNLLGWQYYCGVLDPGVADPYAWPRTLNGQLTTCTTYVTTKQVDDTLAWIQAQTSPWACVLSFCAPHAPFVAPPANLHTRNLAGLDPNVDPRPFFEAMVEAMDTEIGRLLATLGPTTLANTNIILFGDNGTDGTVAVAPFSPTKVKGSLYEGAIRVPFIAKGPAVVAPGRECDALVSIVDIFPTVLDLCGVPLASVAPSPAGPLDGVSFKPLLANTRTWVRDHVYIDWSFGPYGGGYKLVTPTHGLIRKITGPWEDQEMYRVDGDPLENHDLLAAPLSAADAASYAYLSGLLTAIRPDGWVENIGIGCTQSTATPPRLRSQTMPRVGQPYFLQVLGLGSATSIWLTVGTSLGHNGAPVQLGNYGIPGCVAYASDDVALLIYDNLQLSSGFFPLIIPPMPWLQDQQFYTQAYVVTPGLNAAGLEPTNGQHVTIGI